MRRIIGGALAALALIPARAQAKYWENGDFDIPKPKAGSFALVDAGERYGVWRVIGEAGNVAWVSGGYKHRGFTFPAQGNTPDLQAEPWVNLAGLSMSATGIMHSPQLTKVGQSYTLSFYVGNVVDPTGSYGNSSTVLVYQNATLLATVTNRDGDGTKVMNWKPFSVTFKANYPYTTIAFVNGDKPGDMICGISNTLFAPAAGTQDSSLGNDGSVESGLAGGTRR